MNATTDNDTLIGTVVSELIDGLEGNDSIEGLQGNDTLLGNDGNDTLDGGEGNDQLNGGSGINLIDGGSGSDTLTLNYSTLSGSIRYSGSSENYGSTYSYTKNVYGYTSKEYIHSHKNVEKINLTGTNFDDTISSSGGNDTLDGGKGNDFLDLDLSDRTKDLKIATDFASANDQLIVDGKSLAISNFEKNHIVGGDGLDTISLDYSTLTGSIRYEGVGGNYANIYSSTGKEYIHSHESIENVNLAGTNFNDTISSSGGNDTLDGGKGNDVLNLNFYHQTSNLDVNVDLTITNNQVTGIGEMVVDNFESVGGIETGSGDDTISLTGVDLDNKRVNGGDGLDSLDADFSDLTTGISDFELLDMEAVNILGTNFDDTLKGSSGKDTLQGNNGNDNIEGNNGNDVLIGNGGKDRFLFKPNSGEDTIRNFVTADDVIEVNTGYGLNSIEEVLSAIESLGTSNGSLVSQLTFNDNNFVRIFHDGDLTAQNFAIARPLQINSASLKSSGFVLEFNQEINPELLNINGSQNPDLIFQNSQGEQLDGSLVWEPSDRTLTFISVDGTLPRDNYKLTLVSGEDGLVSLDNRILDGDFDGEDGENFVDEFSNSARNKRILQVDNFVPQLNPNDSNNLEITLDDGADVTAVDFTLSYNSQLLDLSDLQLNPDLPDSWKITEKNVTTPGEAVVSLSGDTALNSGAIDLISFSAAVPNDATYGASDILTVDSVSLNNGSIDALGSQGVQTTRLKGDLDSNTTHSNIDAALISQISVGIYSGLDDSSLISPNLIADLNNDGIVSAFDSYLATL